MNSEALTSESDVNPRDLHPYSLRDPPQKAQEVKKIGVRILLKQKMFKSYLGWGDYFK